MCLNKGAVKDIGKEVLIVRFYNHTSLSEWVKWEGDDGNPEKCSYCRNASSSHLLPLLSLVPSYLESVEIGEHLLLWINVKSKIYFTFETFAN